MLRDDMLQSVINNVQEILNLNTSIEDLIYILECLQDEIVVMIEALESDLYNEQY